MGMKRKAATLLVAMLLVGNVASCTPREIRELKRTYETTTKNQNSLVAGETTTNGQPINIDALIDNETPYEELITKEIDIHEFVQKFCISNLTGSGSLNRVNNEIGIECLRCTEAGALYSVHKVKQGGLLYIFYTRYEDDSAVPPILRWFYVPKKRSRADFGTLQTGLDITDPNLDLDGIDVESLPSGSNINAVKAIDPSVQIFENLGNLQDKEYWDSNYLLTWHYLSDGIMEICYRYSAGEFKVLIKYFIEDYQIDDYSEPVRERYDGHILEKDQIQ